MQGNRKAIHRYINLLSDETLHSVSPTDVDFLIQRGLLKREGAWYRVYDLRILSNELYGLIKRIFITNKKTLVQLY